MYYFNYFKKIILHIFKVSKNKKGRLLILYVLSSFTRIYRDNLQGWQNCDFFSDHTLIAMAIQG